ncbi:MAG: PQQ-binding-like beta-propeller repeat protein [Verrucomicrobiota bacterium]|nr:PQQ-binding-like beta-propeller repeat protein [Verrucomicrobiota bacterium]
MGKCIDTPAGDWPQFLGPERNGQAIEEGWDLSSPKKAWELKVGSGFSGPVIVEKNLYIYHRINNQSTLDCLELESGEQVWRYQHITDYRDDFGFDNGPRATPCVSDGRIFLMSAKGILTSVNADTGKPVWQVRAKERWKAPKGFFGMASSPLVHNDMVIYIIGGKPNAGIVALNRFTGQTRWTATGDASGYASPIIEKRGDRNILWAWTREKIYGLDAHSGDLLASLLWRPSMDASVNAATPLLLPEGIFISASYGTGALLMDRQDGTPGEIWSGDEQMSNHYATCVYHRGYLYGYHGRQEFDPELRCIEASSGRVMWSKKDLGAGSLILAGDVLLLMQESGELILARARSDRFETLGRRQILPSGVRAFPALSRGYFVSRSPELLVAFLLRKKS